MTHGQRLDELVRACRAGDEGAFRELVATTHGDLRRFVAGRAVDAAMMEEVVQTAYIIAFERLASYRGEGPFDSWLKGIARNCLRREFQRRRRFTGGAHHQVDSWVLDDTQERLDAEEERDDLLDRLRTCLEELPDRSRAIIAKRFEGGATVAELSRDFKRSKSAMAKILQRIILALRACMGREER